MLPKEPRLNILASLRTVLDKKYTAPDPELDVSDAVIASMELGIRVYHGKWSRKNYRLMQSTKICQHGFTKVAQVLRPPCRYTLSHFGG